LKIFPDTNVLFSALITSGLCADLLEHIIAEHELIIGEPVLVELEQVLKRKLKTPDSKIQGTLSFLNSFPTTPTPATLPPVEVRDPDDLLVLAAALNGNAELLVTGDQDLLVLPPVRGIRIVSPRECWDSLLVRSLR